MKHVYCNQGFYENLGLKIHEERVHDEGKRNFKCECCTKFGDKLVIQFGGSESRRLKFTSLFRYLARWSNCLLRFILISYLLLCNVYCIYLGSLMQDQNNCEIYKTQYGRGKRNYKIC